MEKEQLTEKIENETALSVEDRQADLFEKIVIWQRKKRFEPENMLDFFEKELDYILDYNKYVKQLKKEKEELYIQEGLAKTKKKGLNLSSAKLFYISMAASLIAGGSLFYAAYHYLT